MHATCQFLWRYTGACTHQYLFLVICHKSYWKTASLTIKSQRVIAGQYVLANRFFAVDTNMQYDPPDIAVSTLRVARIIHFCVHNFCVGESNHMTHAFALVDWVACVLSRYLIGKPIEIWAASSFVLCTKTHYFHWKTFTVY